MVPGLLSACRQAPLLGDTSVEPILITPNADGHSDVARISYSIGTPAYVTISLADTSGRTYLFRDALPRSPGKYEALFGGVIDGRMLADGEYELVIAATPREDDAGTTTEEARYTLGVEGGDTVPPELSGFTVEPSEFTPNQDGLGDRVAISYRLDEPADVRLWLESASGEYVTDILEEQESGDYPGEPGPHVYDFDAGVDADAPPPPDGDYFVVGRAEDASGNVSLQRLPLGIRQGGQPRVALLGDVEWSDIVLPIGGTLHFTVTVTNVGDTPIRTRGPAAGFVYDNDTTFNQAAPIEAMLLARHDNLATSLWVSLADGDVMDLGLELANDSPEAGLELGPAAPASAVEPTKPITVCGTVTVEGEPVRSAEVYMFEADGDNGLATATDSYGRFCFQDITVPPPHERTYSRSPGAIRLGLEYDEIRTDLSYPYRWQLGDAADLSVCQTADRRYLCLAPGQTVEVTGGVHFVEAPFRRQTRVYVALMHEDVRRIQGPYGQQQITIEY